MKASHLVQVVFCSFYCRQCKTIIASVGLFQAIENEIRVVVDETVKKAKADKEIPLDEVSSDIYAQNYEDAIRNITPFNPLKHKRIGPAVNLK